MLGQGPTYGINGNIVSPEKKFRINFSKGKTKLCFSLYYSHDNSYLFVNREEIFKFKAGKKIVNFSTQLRLGSISNRFGAAEFREASLK